MLGIRENCSLFFMFLVALISAHQLLVNFDFSFKTVVKNKKECVFKIRKTKKKFFERKT